MTNRDDSVSSLTDSSNVDIARMVSTHKQTAESVSIHLKLQLPLILDEHRICVSIPFVTEEKRSSAVELY